MEGQVVDAGGFVEPLKDISGFSSDTLSINAAVCNMRVQAADNRICQARSVTLSGFTMLKAIMNAQKEFIP